MIGELALLTLAAIPPACGRDAAGTAISTTASTESVRLPWC